MLKKLISFIVCATVFLFISAVNAYAETSTPDTAAITDRIYHASGADELWSFVPEDASGFLDAVGFTGFLPDSVKNIEPGTFISKLGEAVQRRSSEPLRALMSIAAIVMISAALETVRTGGASDSVLSLIVTLCTISVIAPPMMSLAKDLADTITISGNFMLFYVPVTAGLTIASGRAAGGTVYCGVMIYAASALMQLTVRVIVPMLKCVMSLSLVSSACEKVNLGGMIDLFKKASRFLLTFGMSLFAAFLTMKTIVAAASDSLGNRAVKFAVSSFVPLVGGALSDAYQTVVSCVLLLRSGVGAAGIAVIFAIFLPAGIRCVLWQAVSAAGCALCDLFGLSKVSSLLSQISGIISVMFAVLMCTMVIYIISTAIVIIAGG